MPEPGSPAMCQRRTFARLPAKIEAKSVIAFDVNERAPKRETYKQILF